MVAFDPSAPPDPSPEDVFDFAAALARELARLSGAAGATALAALFRAAALEAAREKAALLSPASDEAA